MESSRQYHSILIHIRLRLPNTFGEEKIKSESVLVKKNWMLRSRTLIQPVNIARDKVDLQCHKRFCLIFTLAMFIHNLLRYTYARFFFKIIQTILMSLCICTKLLQLHLTIYLTHFDDNVSKYKSSKKNKEIKKRLSRLSRRL